MGDAVGAPSPEIGPCPPHPLLLGSLVRPLSLRVLLLLGGQGLLDLLNLGPGSSRPRLQAGEAGRGCAREEKNNIQEVLDDERSITVCEPQTIQCLRQPMLPRD